VTHTVYGRVPALQDADTGNYADSILVTLTF
jgi:spore coat protein U-like protein